MFVSVFSGDRQSIDAEVCEYHAGHYATVRMVDMACAQPGACD